MTKRRLIGAFLVLMAAGPALADGEGAPPKPPKAGELTPAALFAKEKACQAASDGCQTCKRTGDGFSCSTPGIACMPRVYTCTEKTAP